MAKPLDLASVLKRDAASLRLARASAALIHPSDIRAAGNEVEKAVRDYIRRILPRQYYVTSGHLIDTQHRLSPQIDVIIADTFNLPSLYTAQDGTEYVPITSVYAIGEVKSTYYKSKGYLQKMTDTLATIAAMDRPLVENTAYKGEIRDDTTIRDMMLGSGNRFLNHLFSFLFCVDAGDFQFEDIASHLRTTHVSALPSVAVLLNRGVLLRARESDAGGISWCRYPTEAPPPDYDWMFAESTAPEASGSKDGSSLAVLYGMLVEHLRNSHLEASSAYGYTRSLMSFRRSTLRWANSSSVGPRST
ncbi:MAG: hypothetical protein OXS35_05495 [Dehalococcoidia bacterium]|nr:hypothetical protein [Dehalococcoidia bacterium]